MHVFTREDLHLIWEELQPLLQASADQSPGYNLEALQRLLNDGKAVTFALFKDNRLVWMILMQLVEYPLYRTARIVAHAGVDFHKAREFEQMIDDWAVLAGAVEIEGWCADERVARLVQRAGYVRKYSVMVKDLRRKLQ